MRRGSSRWGFVAVLASAGWAFAQEPAVTAEPRTAVPAVTPVRAPRAAPVVPDRHVRVRGSHTVDVIAPGEKVDTIIERMHAKRPALPPGEQGAAHNPPPRPPDRKHGPNGPLPPHRGGPRGPPPPFRTDGPPPLPHHR